MTQAHNWVVMPVELENISGKALAAGHALTTVPVVAAKQCIYAQFAWFLTTVNEAGQGILIVKTFARKSHEHSQCSDVAEPM